MTNGEARKTLKQAKLTARRIREDGDPLHGSFAPPAGPAQPSAPTSASESSTPRRNQADPSPP